MFSLPGIDGEEMMFIKESIKDLTEEQQKTFIMLYQGRRKDPQMILICTVIGLLGIAGIQRFLLGQVGMGILYFFTGGLCLIGTIVDLVNHKKLTLEYNQRVVIECRHIAQSMG